LDYKSSGKKIDYIFMANGIQLQLPGYLAALRGIEGVGTVLGVEKLRLAGIFFVNLSGDYKSAGHRNEILRDPDAIHKAAFQHKGRFDDAALSWLDSRGADCGDQFSYKR